MTAVLQKKQPGLIRTIRRLFTAGEAQMPPAPAAPATASALYAPGQQRQLEALFAQLMARPGLVASGRLQMLGFDKIRARMGNGWPALRDIVHRIADEVIQAARQDGDIFLRYKDDSYLLIFASANTDEGRQRASRMAEDIGARLTALRREELKIIQVDAQVSAIHSDAVKGRGFEDAMLALTGLTEQAADEAREIAQEAAELQARMMAARAPACAYHPLWNSRRRALSAYLCELQGHANAGPVERDLDTLRAARDELSRMAARGDDACLVVPVRHGTLFNEDSSQKYQMIYRDIPEEQRRNLIFLIVNYLEGLPAASAFWFVPALKSTCRHVFVEMPLRTRANLAAFKNRGIDGIGVTVEGGIDEAVTLGYLAHFSGLVEAAGVAQTLVFNVPSLSLITSASCMGFAYIGGSAIHGVVPAPDKSHRFRYAELFDTAK